MSSFGSDVVLFNYKKRHCTIFADYGQIIWQLFSSYSV